MKLTRRQMVAVTAGSAVAVKAVAQSAPASSPDGVKALAQSAAAPDAGKAARDAVQRNADTLAKFGIPVSTEPAFQFKA